MICRQVKWRKTPDQFIWRSIVDKRWYKIDCKLVVHAGIGGSSVANRHAVLEVMLPEQDGKYRTHYRFEFSRTHTVKEYIDALLYLLWRREATEEQALEWFINELRSRESLQPAINSCGDKLLGYSI